MHLYVLAAPVFEEHGYRGATIKALAYACHLSPSSLHHYFGSKAEMGTYPLTGPAIDWASRRTRRCWRYRQRTPIVR